jgi:5-carboxyvanillate decarboxylase
VPVFPGWFMMDVRQLGESHMTIDRREFLSNSSAALVAGAIGATGAAGEVVAATVDPAARTAFRRIATEEAFSIPEQMEGMRGIVASSKSYDPDLYLWDIVTKGGVVHDRLLDLEHERIRIMDEHGVDVHLLSLTSTGVQMFDADRGSTLATLANDRLAEVIRRHPDRFAGLGSFAPQDPARAVREIERAMTTLKLNGMIVNSHTNGEYLSERKYWPILEALEALNAPLYIHPRAPSPQMAQAFHTDHLEHAIFGYTVETGLHGLKLIMAGVFDQFPKLKIVLGHNGENVQFHLYRTDYMYRLTIGMMNRIKLKQLPSDYFQQNFMITTSGVNWHPALVASQSILGADNIMFAVDYPYQETGEAVTFLNTAPISDADKAKIFYRNAERIFRIPPRA